MGRLYFIRQSETALLKRKFEQNIRYRSEPYGNPQQQYCSMGHFKLKQYSRGPHEDLSPGFPLCL